MKTIHFPEWPQVLTEAQLPESFRRSAEITIRWYLSFCRRARVEVTVQSARDFIEWATKEKHPEPWQLEDWKEGIRWFFRAAKEQPTSVGSTPVGATPSAWFPPESAQWPEWKVAFLTTLRRRKYSYRTEESYIVWIEQFARHLGTDDLRAQAEQEISRFLDVLALNERLSASSQRQALNALVFLYREVFGRQLGDFSEYRRAKARTHLPVWLTKEEIERLFASLDERIRLMARVMYGSGSRPFILVGPGQIIQPQGIELDKGGKKSSMRQFLGFFSELYSWGRWIGSTHAEGQPLHPSGAHLPPDAPLS